MYGYGDWIAGCLHRITWEDVSYLSVILSCLSAAPFHEGIVLLYRGISNS